MLEILVPSYAIVYDKTRLRQILREAALEIASAARNLIAASVGSGRRYGKHVASAPGQPPVSITDKLLNSIKVRNNKGGLSVSVIDATFYAKMLETGAVGGGGRKGSRNIRRRGQNAPVTTRVLQPRPFLTVALAQNQDSLSARIQEAITQGIDFRHQEAP